MTKHRTYCRTCCNGCSLIVEIEDNRVVDVAGDPGDPRSRGYSCPKGRQQAAYLEDDQRLRRSMKRMPDGSYQPISTRQAIAEIAAKLSEIRDRFGPRAIAGYTGTMAYVAAFPGLAFYERLLDAIGTRMVFTPNTIDKGGKDTALSFHGRWMAPAQGFDDPDSILLLGINPVLTYTGFPIGTPRWYGDGRRKGVKTVVIDPRRSDAARLAFLHLQPRPGCDAQLLAAMVRVILEEELFDRAFVAENVEGLDALRRSVSPFTLEAVAAYADVQADQIALAARTYATAARGYTMAGTGPNMSGPSTLVEYLVLCIETLCGRWLRAGDLVRAAPTLAPAPQYKAQAQPPRESWAFGEAVRVRGLSNTEAGMPTAAISDEILTPGEGQVRALISFGGNPAAVFPDHTKIAAALDSLELLVQIDPWMSATAKHAHYVIAPPLPLEAPSTTFVLDLGGTIGRKTGYGGGEAYANYTPALVTPPAGSELIEEWRFFYEVLCAMGFDPVVANPYTPDAPPIQPGPETTTDDILEWFSQGSRIPLSTVKAAEGGVIYADPPVVVGSKDEGWTGRLQIGSGEIMGLIERAAAQMHAGPISTPDRPFRLLCRRETDVYNTNCIYPGKHRRISHNPAHLHPDDLQALGVSEGDLIEIASDRGAIPAVAAADETLRRGLVSMMFGFGGGPEGDHLVREIGSNVNRLITDDEVFDPYTGQPRMSNVPISVRRLEADGTRSDDALAVPA